MTLSVITNADDFGITPGVNASIVACHQGGSLTSATLMANMDAAEHAATLAAANPQLGVGLHFNLTLGSPLATPGAVPSLVDGEGNFLDRGALLRRAVSGRIVASQVETELHAQLKRMRALGLDPSHFDSHQHVHAVPTIFAVLSGLAEPLGKPVRVPWRWRGKAGRKPLLRLANELALQTMVARCMAKSSAGLITNDGLCSVFDLQRPASDLIPEDYFDLLRPYSTGVVELMVHPGLVDAELARKTEITAVSAVEDRLLRSDFIRSHVESRGGRLVSYRDVV